MRKYTTIKGENSVSQIRRLPRLGKIRLGIIKKSPKTGKEYPSEVDYFVVPEAVQKIYGPKPKELDVMFPVEQEEMIFPQFLGAYGGNHKLLCHGNGEEAERWNKDTKEWEKRDCPCEWLEEKKCARRSNLMIVLPRVNLGGIWQVDSGSFNSIVNINSYFEFLRFLVGRISWIPVKLIREAQQTLDPEGKNQTHYPIKVVFEGTVEAVNALRQESDRIISQVKTYALPEPIMEGPLPDTPIEEIKELDPQDEIGDSDDPTDQTEQPPKEPSQVDVLAIQIEEAESMNQLETIGEVINSLKKQQKLNPGDIAFLKGRYSVQKGKLK